MYNKQCGVGRRPSIFLFRTCCYVVMSTLVLFFYWLVNNRNFFFFFFSQSSLITWLLDLVENAQWNSYVDPIFVSSQSVLSSVARVESGNRPKKSIVRTHTKRYYGQLFVSPMGPLRSVVSRERLSSTIRGVDTIFFFFYGRIKN